MIRRILSAASALALIASPAVPALAQSNVDLTGDVKVIRTLTENGKTRETLDEPERVLPGDRLVFTTRYANTGTEAAEDFVITNPLPGPVKLAQVGEFQVSIDGGKNFGPLRTLKVEGNGGEQRTAELSDVTHIRWTLPRVAPGDSGQVRYFAEVR